MIQYSVYVEARDEPPLSPMRNERTNNCLDDDDEFSDDILLCWSIAVVVVVVP